MASGSGQGYSVMAYRGTRKPRYQQLTDAKIRRTKPGAKPVKLFDTGGLYLLISPESKGGRHWRWKFYLHDKERLMSLGPYPAIGLAEARKRRDAARELVQKGIDPVEHRRAEKASKREAAEQKKVETAQTFKVVADDYIAHRDKSTATKTRYKARWTLGLLSPLHKRPVAQIRTPDVVEVCKAIELENGVEAAHRAASFAKRVFEHAGHAGIVDVGYNPAQTVTKVLTPLSVVHRAAVTDPVEIGRLLEAIDNYTGSGPIVSYALRLTPYVFLRPGELRALEWSWIDLDDALITVPGRAMKKGRDHLVPIAPQVATLLTELREVTGDGKYLFPGKQSDRCLSENGVRVALVSLGYEGRQTPHGFRTIASTLLHELGYDRDLVALQMSHVEKDKTRDAYNRALRLDDRRDMMRVFADHLDELKASYWLKT